jgi:hypothetical protein
MKLSISIPNDYGSEGDNFKALAEEGSKEEMLETLACAACDAGLKFEEEKDFGAIWSGSAMQINAAKAALPGWAYVGEIS